MPTRVFSWHRASWPDCLVQMRGGRVVQRRLHGAAFPAQRKATVSDSRKGTKETDGVQTPGGALIVV